MLQCVQSALYNLQEIATTPLIWLMCVWLRVQGGKGLGGLSYKQPASMPGPGVCARPFLHDLFLVFPHTGSSFAFALPLAAHALLLYLLLFFLSFCCDVAVIIILKSLCNFDAGFAPSS